MCRATILLQKIENYCMFVENNIEELKKHTYEAESLEGNKKLGMYSQRAWHNYIALLKYLNRFIYQDKKINVCLVDKCCTLLEICINFEFTYFELVIMNLKCICTIKTGYINYISKAKQLNRIY